MPIDNIGSFLVLAQSVLMTGNLSKEILSLIKACGIVRRGVDFLEHLAARQVSVRHRPVAIILEEVAAVQHWESDRDTDVCVRGHISKDVAQGVLRVVDVGLLDAEFGQKHKEIACIPSTLQMLRADRVGGQRQQCPQEKRSQHFSSRLTSFNHRSGLLMHLYGLKNGIISWSFYASWMKVQQHFDEAAWLGWEVTSAYDACRFCSR